MLAVHSVHPHAPIGARGPPGGCSTLGESVRPGGVRWQTSPYRTPAVPSPTITWDDPGMVLPQLPTMMLYPLAGAKTHEDAEDGRTASSSSRSSFFAAPAAFSSSSSFAGASGALRFTSASASKQHPIKSSMGMIDADRTETSPTLLGICDGVSEVQKLGVRPDALPRELLRCLRENLESRRLRGLHPASSRSTCQSDTDGSSWVLGALEESFAATKSYGSTTVLFAVLEDANHLVVANLGDSCLLVLRLDPQQPRKLQVTFRTQPLRYDADKPLQVMRLQGVNNDRSAAALKHTHVDTVQVQHGDIIVLGSDGLWDNLHDEEVVAVVERHCLYPQVTWTTGPLVPLPEQLEDAANALVKAAHDRVCLAQVGSDGKRWWPAEARQTPSGIGGKADDTTAIVAAITMVGDKGACSDCPPKVAGPEVWFNGTCCGMPPMSPPASPQQATAGTECTVS